LNDLKGHPHSRLTVICRPKNLILPKYLLASGSEIRRLQSAVDHDGALGGENEILRLGQPELFLLRGKSVAGEILHPNFLLISAIYFVKTYSSQSASNGSGIKLPEPNITKCWPSLCR